MGLLSGLLLFPIAGPVRGLRFVLEQIREEADSQLFDENAVQAELMSLDLLYRQGEISDEEYEAREAELFDYLNAIRASNEGRGEGDEYWEGDAW